MKVNYIILAHKEPQQLSRLVSRLLSDDIHCYIHLDSKCAIEGFMDTLPESESVIYIKDRKSCRWGDMSIVDAIIACYREIVRRQDIGFCVLLSGQDYPLRSPEYIKAFFALHQHHNFINIYPIPDPQKKSENGGLERLVSYTFDCCNPSNPRMKAKIQPLSLRLKTLVGFLRLAVYRRELLPLALRLYFKTRQYPQGLAMCFNEAWTAFNYPTVVKLLDIIDSHPEYSEYYQFTHIPDETMFGAIMCANRELSQSILPMCHYINWTGGRKGSPKTLQRADYPEIKKIMTDNSSIMFARKFGNDTHILNLIDEEIRISKTDNRDREKRINHCLG